MVFIIILSCEKLIDFLPPLIYKRGNSSVMPRRHLVSTQRQSRLKKNIEFHFSITENIWIGCSSFFVFGEHVIYDSFLVKFAHVYHLKRNTQFLRHQKGIITILYPWAFVLQSHRSIIPVSHKKPDNLVPLLFQQVGGNTAVHAS